MRLRPGTEALRSNPAPKARGGSRKEHPTLEARGSDREEQPEELWVRRHKRA